MTRYLLFVVLLLLTALLAARPHSLWDALFTATLPVTDDEQKRLRGDL